MKSMTTSLVLCSQTTASIPGERKVIDLSLEIHCSLTSVRQTLLQLPSSVSLLSVSLISL